VRRSSRLCGSGVRWLLADQVISALRSFSHEAMTQHCSSQHAGQARFSFLTSQSVVDLFFLPHDASRERKPTATRHLIYLNLSGSILQQSRRGASLLVPLICFYCVAVLLLVVWSWRDCSIVIGTNVNVLWSECELC
jgi:hypothetical protein